MTSFKKYIILWISQSVSQLGSSMTAFAASLPIPFIMACQNLILYKKVPENIQGRVFALRNAVHYAKSATSLTFPKFLLANDDLDAKKLNYIRKLYRYMHNYTQYQLFYAIKFSFQMLISGFA